MRQYLVTGLDHQRMLESVEDDFPGFAENFVIASRQVERLVQAVCQQSTVRIVRGLPSYDDRGSSRQQPTDRFKWIDRLVTRRDDELESDR